MAVQNTIYALIQVLHNFGAVAIVGLAAAGVMHCYKMFPGQRLPVIVLAIAWVLQAMSGAAFGITTLWFSGQLPDIHGVAVVALAIKVISVVSGFALTLLYLRRGSSVSQRTFWYVSLALGAVALTAAAFLRWFS